MSVHKIIHIVASFVIAFTVFTPITIYAQDIGISNTYFIDDIQILEGDIVSLDTILNKFVRATGAEDEQVFGVYIENPTVVLRTDPTFSPIVREGDVQVNVTTIGGPIAPGDKIAASPIAGKGQRATEEAMVALGTALTGLIEGDGPKETHEGAEVTTGKVKVALDVEVSKTEVIEPAGGLIDRLKQLFFTILSTLKKGEDVSRILRYIIAGLVAIITVYLSFNAFGRNITKGIESIGRNPLAKVSIQSMIVLNIVLIAVVTIGGVILTLLIIKF